MFAHRRITNALRYGFGVLPFRAQARIAERGGLVLFGAPVIELALNERRTL